MRDFVGTIEYEPPSLVELSARCIKLHGVPYGPRDLPASLIEHLGAAKRCVNKRCKGELRLIVGRRRAMDVVWLEAGRVLGAWVGSVRVGVCLKWGLVFGTGCFPSPADCGVGGCAF